MIIGIIGIAVGIGVICSIGYVVNRVRYFSRVAFGTSDIIEGIKNQEELYENTPKSISGMTRLELPRIESDFPEFNWDEWRQICENTIIDYLEAIEHQSLSYLKSDSSSLRNQVSVIINDAKENNRQEAFSSVNIHKTEITSYVKTSGICKIRIQTALEYSHTLSGDNIKVPITNKKEQHRYNSELVYIQDITMISEFDQSFGVTCPNCGAPITKLGNKFCEYCGIAVEPVNIRVWTLHRIELV